MPHILRMPLKFLLDAIWEGHLNIKKKHHGRTISLSTCLLTFVKVSTRPRISLQVICFKSSGNKFQQNRVELSPFRLCQVFNQVGTMLKPVTSFLKKSIYLYMVCECACRRGMYVQMHVCVCLSFSVTLGLQAG